MKINCWQFMKCGREPGGENTEKFGVCPVATKEIADGLNGGINAGRICWVVAENRCMCNTKSSHFHGKDYCFQCQFRYKVLMEEGLLNVCNATGAFLSHSAQ